MSTNKCVLENELSAVAHRGAVRGLLPLWEKRASMLKLDVISSLGLKRGEIATTVTEKQDMGTVPFKKVPSVFRQEESLSTRIRGSSIGGIEGNSIVERNRTVAKSVSQVPSVEATDSGVQTEVAGGHRIEATNQFVGSLYSSNRERMFESYTRDDISNVISQAASYLPADLRGADGAAEESDSGSPPKTVECRDSDLSYLNNCSVGFIGRWIRARSIFSPPGSPTVSKAFSVTLRYFPTEFGAECVSGKVWNTASLRCDIYECTLRNGSGNIPGSRRVTSGVEENCQRACSQPSPEIQPIIRLCSTQFTNCQSSDEEKRKRKKSRKEGRVPTEAVSTGENSNHGRRCTRRHFTREPSAMPATMAFPSFRRGNDTPSDDSGSSSDSILNSNSSSSSEGGVRDARIGSERRRKSKNKKRARKMRKMLSHIKVNPPAVYSGTPDIEELDSWAYSVDSWISMHALDEKWAVRLAVNFLSDKASTFYMRHVAKSRRGWTMKQLYEGIFDYCFPPGYKSELRDKLMHYQQGNLFFADFAREVENLADKFVDITKRQRVFIIWKGASRYIRLKWIDRGLSPEDVKWDKLLRYASKFEASELQRKKEETRTSHKHASDTDSEGEDLELRAEGASGSEKESLSDVELHLNSGMPESEGSVEEASTNGYRPRIWLPDEEYRFLKEEGRCFRCKRRGHEARICNAVESRSPSPRASRVKSGSVHFSGLNEMLESSSEEEGNEAESEDPDSRETEDEEGSECSQEY